MMRCDIIIPVWNQLEATRECIDSIAKNTDYPHRLIIVDNGSDEDTAGYLRDIRQKDPVKVELVRNKENCGFAKAVNQGFALSSAPYVCIMNNDTIASNGWLGEMIKVMESHPGIGILNPSSNTSGQFPEGKSIESYAASLKSSSGETQELYNARGFCMLLKKEVIESVGFFDEDYTVGYFEETDYCKRAHAKGIGVARAKAAYVFHKESLSFKELKEREAIFKRNEAIFFSRWGRPLRVGCLVGRAGHEGEIDDIATDVARQGHQSVIFLKRGLNWPVRLDHFDIRRVDISPLLFELVSIFKILKRKAKKRIDVLLTYDAAFGSFLKTIESLHGASVVVGPSREGVLTILRDRSKKY